MRWLVVAAAVAFHVSVVSAFVARRHADVDVLVCAGHARAAQFPYRRIKSFNPGHGYDGQYYYAIAQQPWGHQTGDVDFPPGRQLRLLYPALCWLLSAGKPWLLAWSMPFVNLVAIACLAYLGAVMALKQGLSPWWGLLLTLGASVSLPALRNLTDTLSTLTILGLFAAWLARGPSWTIVVWAAAAVFCREQNSALVGIVVLCAILEKRWSLVLGILAVLGSWLLWVALLRWHYGCWPFITHDGNFVVPGSTLIKIVKNAMRGESSWLFTLGIVTLVAQVLALAYLISKRMDLSLRLFAGVALVLALIVGPSIYAEIWSFHRVLVWVPAALWLGAIQTGCRWPIVLLLPGVVWPIAAALTWI